VVSFQYRLADKHAVEKMEGFPVPHAVLSAWSAEKMYAGQTLSPLQKLKGFFFRWGESAARYECRQRVT